MKLLVTGGSGLVGKYVVETLRSLHTVEVLDIRPPKRSDIRHLQVDILDLTSLKNVVREYDAVVHLAGIPHPLNTPGEEVFRVNALGTYNILEACVIGGVRRLVFMSSESTLGFAFSTTRNTPQYLPIDEAHALRPQDPYGLSKVTCELLCRGFSSRSGIQTVCLRAPWIWVPEPNERQMYRQLIKEYPKWYKNLWACIHVEDVAQAIQRSLAAEMGTAHEAVFIAANDNWTGKESRSLAEEFYPETRQLNLDFQGTASFISSRKAKELLKFIPSHSPEDIFEQS